VLRSNSRGKKLKVEEHHRNVKLPKNKTSVTTCNHSLNAKTLNVKSVSAMCDKCMMIDKHDLCVLNSIAKPLKKTVAFESNKKPRNNIRKLYERFGKIYKWSYIKFTPSGYMWKPKSPTGNVNPNLIEIVLFIVDSGCSKHMTGNLKLLINFVEKFLGTVKFGNEQIAPILGYGDLVQGAVMIKRVYYVEGLNHNLFSVGQFYDADLEVAFRKSTCFIRDLKGNDLLTGSRGTDLYSITLQDSNSPNPICLMGKATSSQAWLWHHRLSHLNFDPINLLLKNDIVVGLPKLKFIKDYICSSCELGKAKRKSFHSKLTLSSKRRLQLLHMDLCGPMRVASINGKRYVLVIVDDYSRYTWTHFLRDGENLDKIKEKGDECIFVGYSSQLRAYRVFNKRTRVIMESIHVNFDELPQMASDQNSSDPTPECQTMALEHNSLSPRHKCQENVSHRDKTVTTLNELDLLFSPMFDELLNGPSQVVPKSSAVTTADECIQRQQLTTSLVNHTTSDQSCQVQSHESTVTSNDNIIQVELNAENDQVADDEFINIFLTPVQDQGETSSRHVDSSNMHTFYQRYPSKHRWTKDHPLEQVIGNPSQSVRTRRQLELDVEMWLNHNLFSVGQFCHADLEVAFRKSTKAKRKSFHSKLTPSSKRRLHLLHIDLCGPTRVASINGKIHVLVIVDDYSRYTWTHFLRSKDETPEVLIDFLQLVQRGLQTQVRVVQTDKGTKILNQTLHAYFAAKGIQHQTSIARTPEQNGVVERRNRTLVEAARTMLSTAKVPLFFWAKAIATACFTQNRSLVIPRHEKTPYHIIND
nr:hypothetical protein [Tanacetum cinerariifolium]